MSTSVVPSLHLLPLFHVSKNNRLLQFSAAVEVVGGIQVIPHIVQAVVVLVLLPCICFYQFGTFGVFNIYFGYRSSFFFSITLFWNQPFCGNHSLRKTKQNVSWFLCLDVPVFSSVGGLMLTEWWLTSYHFETQSWYRHRKSLLLLRSILTPVGLISIYCWIFHRISKLLKLVFPDLLPVLYLNHRKWPGIHFEKSIRRLFYQYIFDINYF